MFSHSHKGWPSSQFGFNVIAKESPWGRLRQSSIKKVGWPLAQPSKLSFPLYSIVIPAEAGIQNSHRRFYFELKTKNLELKPALIFGWP